MPSDDQKGNPRSRADLPERLRRLPTDFPGRSIYDEAAREIERLRAALQKIVDQDWWEPSSKQGDEPDAVDGRCAEIARAALEGSAT